jgi:hypothetical protein
MAKADALKEIERAEKALEQAKAKHRAEFRKAVFAVYEAYGLRLDSNGDKGERLVITSLGSATIDEVVPQ